MLQDSATRDMRYTWFEVLESNPLRDTKFSKTAGRGGHKHGYAQGEKTATRDGEKKRAAGTSKIIFYRPSRIALLGVSNHCVY